MFGYAQIVVRGLRNGEKRGIKMLIVIVGDFGVGKDTVADMCIDLLGDEACKIKSWTTRRPRYPHENTHNFVLTNDSDAYFNEIISQQGDLVAYTKIDNEYYWVTFDQFNNCKYEFYITDKKGACDVFDNIDEKKLLIEIRRPKELISIDKDRLNREKFPSQPNVPMDICLLNNYDNLNDLRNDVLELVNCIIYAEDSSLKEYKSDWSNEHILKLNY